jgi:RNAse (barnase) inhibitor barstar
MRNWSKLFRAHSNSGVYVIKPVDGLSEIEKAASECGLLFFNIDLSGTATKEAFMQHVSSKLDFPLYFGMNWDAFEECISDLSWCPARGYAIVFDKIEEFAQNAPGDLRTAREIFVAAASSWKKKKVAFYIIMVEPALKNK